MKKLNRRQLRKLILTEAYWLNEDAHEVPQRDEDLERNMDAFFDKLGLRKGTTDDFVKAYLKRQMKSQGPDFIKKVLASETISDLIDLLPAMGPQR